MLCLISIAFIQLKLILILHLSPLFTKHISVIREMGGDIPAPDHSPLNIGLILSCVFTFIITAAFNAVAGSGVDKAHHVFHSTVGEISDT